MSAYKPGCQCYDCDNLRRDVLLDTGHMSFAEWASRFMICCPDCGNKRCPRGTWHGNDCSGSNDPNQAGSRYQYSDRPVSS